MKFIKRALKLSIFIGIIIGSVILVSDALVDKTAKNKTFNAVQDVPHNRVGLVLGCARLTSFGTINLYYKYRIDAAVQLYKNKKIDFILLSGDNSRKDYDEPSDMKNDLIARGIPENKIFLDYAGFRTLDSVVRSKAIFGQNKLTFISQKFHNKRAIYIAKRKGIEAVGYNARDITGRYGLKTHLRELLARVKMMLDLTFGKQPKFYGEEIEIG